MRLWILWLTQAAGLASWGWPEIMSLRSFQRLRRSPWARGRMGHLVTVRRLLSRCLLFPSSGQCAWRCYRISHVLRAREPWGCDRGCVPLKFVSVLVGGLPLGRCRLQAMTDGLCFGTWRPVPSCTHMRTTMPLCLLCAFAEALWSGAHPQVRVAGPAGLIQGLLLTLVHAPGRDLSARSSSLHGSPSRIRWRRPAPHRCNRGQQGGLF